jgi:predicted dehydrogenase
MTSTSSRQKSIRVGVVGLSATGGWAAAAHVPALAGLDGYELRALSASSTESARAAGEKYAVPLTFSNAGELARNEEVDLVVVTVKVPQHLDLIRPVLEAGKTVFSEWPLGADLAQAEELADLAHRRGVLTAVGLQARSAPPLRYLRDLIAEGYVGRVLSTSMLGSGGRWGATYDDHGAYLLDVTNGATLLSISFGHSVDALSMVLGEFREVSAHVENLRPVVAHVTSGAVAAKSAEDQVAVTGLLESGAVAAMHFRHVPGQRVPLGDQRHGGRSRHQGRPESVRGAAAAVRRPGKRRRPDRTSGSRPLSAVTDAMDGAIRRARLQRRP